MRPVTVAGEPSRACKSNAALRGALCEAASAGVRKSDSYLGAQFRRFQRRFGRKAEGKAILPRADTLVVMVWHVLAETDAVYEDLDVDWFVRHDDTAAHTRRLVRQLEKLGTTPPGHAQTGSLTLQ